MAENYLIVGDDEYIRETEAKRIKERFLSPAETELNYSVHDSGDIDGVMDSLGTMPFLAEKRVVLVKKAHELSDESASTILSYLENPLKTSVLILSSPGSLRKTRYYRKLSGLVKILKADRPEASALIKWIHAFFRKQGVEISREAAELIIELKGTDTSAIKMELDKLACFSGGGKIDLRDVEQLVGRSVTETVFRLVDAINARDAGWAFRILGDLYDQKKQPHEVIGYLGWYVRVMQKIVLLSAEGAGLEKIAAELGYSFAYTRRLLTQAKEYPVSRISRWTSLLFETDRDIKRGRKQPALAVEMLLVSFLSS